MLRQFIVKVFILGYNHTVYIHSPDNCIQLQNRYVMQLKPYNLYIENSLLIIIIKLHL